MTTPATWSSIIGAGATKVIADTTTENGTFAASLPFAFKFFGVNHAAASTLTVFQSGYLGFASTPNTLQNTCPLPSTGLPAESIAPFWGRLGSRPTSRGNIYILTQGSAPNRTFTVEWNQMDAFTTVAATTYECVRFSFQAILYETSNYIEFRYNPEAENTCSGGGGTNDTNYAVGGHSSIGLQGAQTGVIVETAACNSADGAGPAVIGTCSGPNPQTCTANKGYLFIPPSTGCP